VGQRRRRVQECITTARAAAAESGKAFGLAFDAAPEAARGAFADGANFVLPGNDEGLLERRGRAGHPRSTRAPTGPDPQGRLP